MVPEGKYYLTFPNTFMIARLTYLAACLLLTFASSGQHVYFSDIVNESALSQGERIPEGLRQNYHSVTYSRQTGFSPSGDLYLEMPGGSTKKVVERSWQFHSAGGFTYTGVIDGDELSSVVLSKVRNRWQGMITANNRNYILQQTSDEIFSIAEVNNQSFETQDIREDMVFEEGAISAHYNVCDAANPCTANPVVINIMVVYTPSARTLWGGTASIEAAITTAISNMNIANVNSGVNPGITFNLAHAAEVDYTESGSTSTDLIRLANGSDDFMDNVQLMRTTFQADLVSLVVGSPTSTCGIGYVNTSSTNYTASAGYNVVVYNCVVSNYSMAHELGHNMGLRHDRYVDLSNTPCAHHHGYVNQAAFVPGASSTKRWRTILAYNDQCAASGFNCNRLNYWANPLVSRNFDPMGIAFDQPNPADEVYGINRFACVVASFQGLNIVPLQWLDVRAKQMNNEIRVQWETANEVQQAGFVVEIAEGLPENFRAMYTTNARNTPRNTYAAAIPARGGKLYFIRIKAIDNDGQVKYSRVIKLENKTDLTAYIYGGTSPVLYVRTPSNKPVSFEVTDALGRKIAVGVINPAMGYNYSLPVGLSGVYFVRVIQNRSTFVLRVLI